MRSHEWGKRVLTVSATKLKVSQSRKDAKALGKQSEKDANQERSSGAYRLLGGARS